MAKWKLVKPGSYLYKRTGKHNRVYYRVLFRHQGIRFDRSFQEIKNDREGLKKAAEIVAQIRNDAEKEKLPADFYQVDQLIKVILKEKVTTATRTQEDYHFYLTRKIQPWFSKHCPYVRNITPLVCEEFIRWNKVINPDAKLYNIQKHLSMLLNRAFLMGIIKQKIALKPSRDKESPGRALSEDEQERLIEYSDELSDIGIQIRLSLYTGMRPTEVWRLRWEDIDFGKNLIVVTKTATKTRKPRSFYAPEFLISILKAKRSQLGRDVAGWVFSSPRNRNKHISGNKNSWTTVRKNANVQCRFEDLRHTFITRALFEHKLTEEQVAAYCGTSTEMIRRNYAHPSPEHTRDVSLKMVEDLHKRISKK